jgi:hypothetical protein
MRTASAFSRDVGIGSRREQRAKERRESTMTMQGIVFMLERP